ncbi:MAG TPA: PAS domain S-box protein [Gallionella sp.]|nr:PAS domain S-box protein [Gallionella sp.]
MRKKIFSPAIALLNRMGYTKKFTVLWLLSMAAIAVVVYSLFVNLDRVIQPSQRRLEGLTLIEPITRVMQALQLHRGLSAALLGGNESLRDARAAQEQKVTAALRALDEKLPPGMIEAKDYRHIREDWTRLQKDGLKWTVAESLAAHTMLIEHLQFFEQWVSDEHVLIMETDVASHYLIDITTNRLMHVLEHLGRLRAYGTGALTRKQLTEDQRIELKVMMAELDDTLRHFNIVVESVERYNPAMHGELQAISRDIGNSVSRVTGLVTADILSGRFATSPQDFLNTATAQIDRSYAQLYDSLLPMARKLTQAHIDRAKQELFTSVGTSLLVFLLVVYLSVSIYYAIIGSIQSLVRSMRVFAGGNLNERVKLDTRDELSLVGESFNEMAHRFSALLQIHREDEARLRATIETAMDAVVQMDDAGIITGWNSQAEKVFGWSRREAVGRMMHETIIPPQYREAHVNGLKHFLATGEGPVLNSRIEITGLHRDGHEFPVELSIAPIKISGVTQGKAAGKYEFSAFTRDITERKQHEREMRIAAAAFDAHEGITVTDENGVIIRVNRTFTTITGYSAEEAIGNTPRVLKSGRHDDEFYLRMWEDLRRDKFWQGEIWNKRKNGEIYPEWLTITAVVGEDGKVNNYVAIFLDITERKRAEAEMEVMNIQLQQANAQIEEERAHLAERVMERTAQLMYANLAKDSFLATMSHEIRTPLGGLLGMLELISLSRLDGKQREMLQVARDSGESLLRIVDDILDWSKIEAGKLKLAPQVTDIPGMLRKVAGTYAQIGSAKGLALRWKVDSKLSEAHVFDSLRLSQILNNFTSNAVKFTEQGEVEISAYLVAQSNGNEEVRFCVKDTGIGIDKEHQARLFKHYEQASANTARMYGGTGLGLAICQRLAELMGGTISVESAPGRGSTFCFTVSLPVASPAAQRELQLRQAREDSGEIITDIKSLVKDGKQVSVLLVDDHPVNRMLLRRQLDSLDVHAEVAASGAEALSLWKTGCFDLVITDCHMPEMDGYELTRSIRETEQHDGRQRMPIIAWTANVLAEEEERCRAAGMDDMLTKPTELADLKAMLLKWLAKAGAISFGEAPLTREKGEGERIKPLSTEGAHPSPLVAPADVPIDFNVLNKIAKSHAVQVEMLQEFSLCNRSDVANLKAALKNGDPEAVARSAHRIKGASRMVGALELEGICAAIERSSALGDLEVARRAAEVSLDEAIARIEAAISAFIAAQ